jgi:DNA-binding HxlR family transcriptional regulator
MPHEAGEQAGELASPAVFDLLGRRWAMRVVWEIGSRTLTYRELAARIPGMSTSVLTQRIRDLRSADLVEHEHGSGYRLTALGTELLAHLRGLQDWADRAGFTVD